MNSELRKEKLLSFVKAQWKLLALGGLILISLVVTLVIPAGNKTAQVTPGTNINNGVGSAPNNNTPTKKPFNPFGFLQNSQDKDKSNTKNQTDTSLKNINSGNTNAPIPSVITKIASNGSKTTQPLSSGSTTQTTQGTISSDGSIQTGVDSNTQPDGIAVVFDNGDGTTTTYVPPGTPPDEVRWGRYTNNTSKYAINFPSNWQYFYSIDANGYEGTALYPPGVDPMTRILHLSVLACHLLS